MKDRSNNDDLTFINYLSQYFVLITIFVDLEEELKKQNKILEEADVEEEKRDLITREIGKFREIMKVSGNNNNYY